MIKYKPPFILPSFLRIAKYLKFKEKDKILILNLLGVYLEKEAFNFENLIQINLKDIDNMIIYLPNQDENKQVAIGKKEIQKNAEESFVFPDISKIQTAELKNTKTEKNSKNNKNNFPPESPKFNFLSFSLINLILIFELLIKKNRKIRKKTS